MTEYGPNTATVKALYSRLLALDWYAAVGQPLTVTAEIAPQSLEAMLDAFYAARADTARDLWQGLAQRARGATDTLIQNSDRGRYQDACQRDTPIYEDFDCLGELLLDTFSGYYKDSFSYPHELIPDSAWLLRAALDEAIVGDLAAAPTFFRDLVPWFECGRLPYGWCGDYPSGRLLVC